MELGKKQELTVAKVVDFGVYLGERRMQQRKIQYCFPASKCRKAQKKGDKLNVFIYRIHRID